MIRYKYALLTLFIACFLIFLSNSMSNSQTVSKRIFLHQNRKNDSQIKSSPLSSGYDNNIFCEFSYEPIPTEAMKRRAKAIFGDQTKKTDEDEEASSILGISNLDDFSYGEQSTILKDLEAEANQTILKQQAEQEKQYKEKLKRNVASYTASVEAKKKRDFEAAERKGEPEEKPHTPKSPFEYYEEENNDNNYESYEIITDSDGKIRIKSPGSSSTSNTTPTTPTASTTPTIPNS